MRMDRVPEVTVSPNFNVELTVESKRHPNQNRSFQSAGYADIIDFLGNSYQLKRKQSRIVRVAPKLVEVESGRDYYRLVFK